MIKHIFILLLLGCASCRAGTVFDHVRAAGTLACGSITEPSDYDKDDTHGRTEPFGADICRAVSAAVFGDANHVTVYGFPDEKTGMEAVASGRIALLVGATPDATSASHLGLVFGQPVFFDGQGFLVRKNAGIDSLADLAGKQICFIGGTQAELDLTRTMKARGISFLPFPFEEVGEMQAALVTGHCRAQTGDVSALGSGRSAFHGQVSAFKILPEQITLDPLAPVVAAGDPEWARVVDWTVFALIESEASGITQANAQALGTDGDDAIRTILGTRKSAQIHLGLPEAWGLHVIRAVGNYGEMFERDLGHNAPAGLERGRNKPWTQGGLLWSPPFR